MPPIYIRSAADFAAAVTLGRTAESLYLDFKHTLETKKPDAQKEVCRDIAQFANADGGSLLIGVSESVVQVSGLKVAKAIEPVTSPDSTREWIEQAINNHLVPSTLTRFVDFIPTSSGIIVAVNVPPSRHTVHVWDRKEHTMQCVRRTNHGKAYMNPDEMERHMMNGSRATRLTIEHLLSAAATNTVGDLGPFDTITMAGSRAQWRPEGLVTITAVGDYAFSLGVPHNGGISTVSLPYEVVRAAWLNTDQTIGLLMSVRIVYRQYPTGALSFEPTAGF